MESTNLALRMTNSGNAEAHHNLVRHIFQTLGIKADPFSVIHSFQGQNTPSVGVSVYHPHDKKAGLYAAANLGLLSDQPGQLVFHPASHGQDWLHSIRLKGEAEQVGQALSGAGINQFHLVPMQGQDGPQFRAMIYDKGGKNLPALKDFAGQVGGEIYTQKGHGLMLGGADKTATNEAYRGVIRKLEGSQQPDPQQYVRKLLAVKKMSRSWEEHAPMINDDVPPGVLADFLDEDNHPSAPIVRGHSREAESQWETGKGNQWGDASSLPIQHGMIQIMPHESGKFFTLRSLLHKPHPETGAIRGDMSHYATVSPEQLGDVLQAADRHDYKPSEYRPSWGGSPTNIMARYRVSPSPDPQMPAPEEPPEDDDQYEAPQQMGRAGKPLKKAAFAPPGQNQQLVVNLPEPVPNQPKQIDASQGPAMPSPEAVIKPMPGNQSTVLPYYAEAANGQV